MMSKPKEHQISFQPDNGLMYLIQQVTGKPSHEILGFFYDFGKEVFSIGIKNMKTNQREIRKNIEDIFPGTAIPFKILVKAYRPYKEEWARGTVEIGFPDNPSYMNQKEVDEMITVILENSLLGTNTNLPLFQAPAPRANKMYKDLIVKALKENSDGTTV